MNKEENKLYNINVDFYYKYKDEDNEEQSDIIVAIKEGEFDMFKLRNINFYDEVFKDEYGHQDHVKNLLQDDKESHKDKKTYNFYLNLPYSKNYITKENLDLVVTKKEEVKKEKRNQQETLEGLMNMYESDIEKIKNGKILNDVTTQLTKNILKSAINFTDNENVMFKGINKENPEKKNIIISEFKTILGNLYKHFYENNDHVDNKPLKDKLRSKPEIISAYNSLLNNIKEENIFERYSNKNYKDFFTENNKDLLKQYFNTLQENLNENISFKNKFSDARYGYKEIPSPPDKLNTQEEYIEIIYKFSEFLLKTEIYEKYKSDKKALYEYVIKYPVLLNNIITYYNVFIILKNIYIIEDTIIYDEKFKNGKYKYIKKIKCINQPEKTGKKSLLHKNNKIFNIHVCFEIEYENINEESIVNFFINFINTEKYISKKVKNKKSKDYINYNSKIFSEKSNILKYIFLTKNLKYKNLINDFPKLKINNPLFIQENPDNLAEALLNKNISSELNSGILENYKDDTEKKSELSDESLTELLEEIFINQIFFKKNNMLYVNNKFYTINKLEYAKRIIEDKKENSTTNKTSINTGNGPVSLQGNRNDNKSRTSPNENIKQNLTNFIIEESPDIRLSIFNFNSKYTTYLDVFCFIRNKKDDKIKFKDKFDAILNCTDSASVLDSLFKKLLGETFNYNTFKNLVSKQTLPMNEKAPIDDMALLKEKAPIDDMALLKGKAAKDDMALLKKKAPNYGLDYNFDLSAGKKNRKKFKKYEKKFKKYKKKNSFRNKVKKMRNKTIKLINLYLKT